MSVDLRAAHPHRGERLVTGRVDERDRAVVVAHLVRTDVLRDAAGLAAHDVGVTDRVEQRGLAVVDVTHDGDDRRARLEQRLVVFSSSSVSIASSSISCSAPGSTMSTSAPSVSAMSSIISSASDTVAVTISPASKRRRTRSAVVRFSRGASSWIVMPRGMTISPSGTGASAGVSAGRLLRLELRRVTTPLLAPRARATGPATATGATEPAGTATAIRRRHPIGHRDHRRATAPTATGTAEAAAATTAGSTAGTAGEASATATATATEPTGARRTSGGTLGSGRARRGPPGPRDGGGIFFMPGGGGIGLPVMLRRLAGDAGAAAASARGNLGRREPRRRRRGRTLGRGREPRVGAAAAAARGHPRRATNAPRGADARPRRRGRPRARAPARSGLGNGRRRSARSVPAVGRAGAGRGAGGGVSTTGSGAGSFRSTTISPAAFATLTAGVFPPFSFAKTTNSSASSPLAPSWDSSKDGIAARVRGIFLQETTRSTPMV